MRGLPRLLIPAALAASALPAGCSRHDAARELEATVTETYWIVDSPRDGQNFIAPVVRFRLRNRGASPLRSIQARARFGGVSDEEPWGSIQEQVSTWRKPLLPGQEREVTVRSAGRFTSSADPADIFRSPGFRDAWAQVFVRIGASEWARLAESPVERRIGARAVQDLGAP